jgi:hypothetical protein
MYTGKKSVLYINISKIKIRCVWLYMTVTMVMGYQSMMEFESSCNRNVDGEDVSDDITY